LAGLVDLFVRLAEPIAGMWAKRRALLDAGVERTSYRESLRETQGSVARLADFGQELRRFAPAGGSIPPGLQPKLSELDATIHRLEDLTREIADLAAWLEAPLPPIDEARLARGIAQVERGEVVNADDILAKLLAREDS
jgi:hypothetical protein